MAAKKRSLINVITAGMLAMISLPVILLGGLVLFGDYYFFRQEQGAIKHDYIGEQEAIFKHEVEKAVDYIQWTRRQQTVPEARLKAEMLNWISRIRFHNKGRMPGFLFVRTFEGIQLVSISRPDLTGRNVSRMTDPNGKNIHDLLLRTVQTPEGGFVDYDWFDPATRNVETQRVFAKAVPQLKWIVGSGFWLDDIERVIFKKQYTFRNRMTKQVSNISLLVSAMFLAQYLIYRVMIRRIGGNFRQFVDFFDTAALRADNMDVKPLYYAEFEQMARSVNKMISERNRAEQALRESENRYRSIIENIDEGYFEVDPNGTITFFNSRLCDMSGYARDELLGMNSRELLEEPDRQKVFTHFADVYETDLSQPEFVCKIIRKDGVRKFVGFTPTVIKDRTGRKIGLRSIVRDVDRQKQYEENLIYLAYHDALTGLKNRKAFYEALQDAIFEARRYGTEIALIYIDIDQFKKVNDTLGHEAGDALLLKIRDRLQDNLRKTDFVCRIGGDEFVVLVDNPQRIHPEVVAEKIVASLSEPYALDGKVVDYISASIGISLFPGDAAEMDGLVKKADQAMYVAKERRNRYVSYADIQQ